MKRRGAISCGGWAALLMLCGVLQTYAAEDISDKSLVVIANANVPESLELGAYYLLKRGLPEENLCILDLPTTENISRQAYSEQLRKPLLRFLRAGEFIAQREMPTAPTLMDRARNMWRRLRGQPPAQPRLGGWQTLSTRVHFLVPMYGVPLRIADLPSRVDTKISTNAQNLKDKTIAAVDSELAVCLYPEHRRQGFVANPVYNAVMWSDGGWLGRITLIASRLDAPQPRQVRAMIDQSLEAEYYGLHGTAYFDARGLREGGYLAGDYWIRDAYRQALDTGYPSMIDSEPDVFPEPMPMNHAALYLGWYERDVKGPFLRDDFRFMPGAVAYHLHSGSAATLRSRDSHWAGPLLDRGAAATLGAVHEPYLQYTVDLDLFLRRLLTGFSFGESAYMAMPVLSWQMAVIGDPLYRPFRYSVDEQIRHMQEDDHPHLAFGYQRKALQLLNQGFFIPAMQYLRSRIEETDSLILRETLGDLYLKNNMTADAGSQYEYILENTDDPELAVRVGRRWTDVLRATGQPELAEQYLSALRQTWSRHLVLKWLTWERPQ